MTDKLCLEEIYRLGIEKYGQKFTHNPMKGITGKFYMKNRKEDLKKTCIRILKERLK